MAKISSSGLVQFTDRLIVLTKGWNWNYKWNFLMSTPWSRQIASSRLDNCFSSFFSFDFSLPFGTPMLTWQEEYASIFWMKSGLLPWTFADFFSGLELLAIPGVTCFSLQSLLNDPNPNSPLNAQAANQWVKERESYNLKVKVLPCVGLYLLMFFKLGTLQIKVN